MYDNCFLPLTTHDKSIACGFETRAQYIPFLVIQVAGLNSIQYIHTYTYRDETRWLFPKTLMILVRLAGNEIVARPANTTECGSRFRNLHDNNNNNKETARVIVVPRVYYTRVVCPCAQ